MNQTKYNQSFSNFSISSISFLCFTRSFTLKILNSSLLIIFEILNS